MKTLAALSIAALSMTAFATGGAHAAAHAKACDDDTVAMVMKGLENAPADKKEMAMSEFNMAKEKMAAGMADECSGHLTKAADLSKAS